MSIVIKKILVFSLFLSVFGCTPGGEQDSLVEPSILITVEGPHFRPALALTASATIKLDYGDGSSASTLNLSAGDHLLESHQFINSAGSHQVLLTVQPWSALSVLNLGFRAGDGGNNTFQTEVPVIMFHPTTTAIPGGTLSASEIQGYVGKVTAISNLQVATELLAICCEQQALTILDCSGLTKLRTVEAYFSSVKSTSFQGCEELRRCCLETTGAKTSWRIINGSRVEDEVLDLRDSHHLQDIRGTNNDRTGIRLHPGAFNTLWHLCTMGNGRMTSFYIGDDSVPLTDLSSFAKLKECWVSYSPVISSLVLTNNTTDTLLVEACGITNVDIHGQVQLRELKIAHNQISVINIDGCTGLDRIYMGYCNFSEAQVDYILATVDGFNTTYNYSGYNATLDLTGNSVPSATGLVHKANLEARNWDVFTAE